MIGAGAGGVRVGSRAFTATPQGGGDKLQGLPPQTNTPVELSSTIRTRGGGGNRNWVFCINQLGGVGRKWGAPAGPGNRAGVSTWCKQKEQLNRKSYPANLTRNQPLRQIRLMPYQQNYTGSSR